MKRPNVGWTIAVGSSALVGTGVLYAALAFVLGVARPDVPYPTAARLMSVDAEERFDRQVAEEIAGTLATRDDLFDHVVVYKDNVGVRMEGDRSPLHTALVGSHDLFVTLGVRPALGRLFAPEEDLPGRGLSVILSDITWRTRFGTDPNILGSTVVLAGYDTLDTYTVVGVLPPGVRFPVGVGGAPDLYLPLGNRHGTELMQNASVLARLASGVTQREATSWFRSVAGRLAPDARVDDRMSLVLARYRGRDVAVGEMRALLSGLLVAAGLALAVSSLNVALLSWLAALQGARGFAVRLALGAGRWRVRAALLARCLLPVALGGTLGIVTAAMAFARLGTTVGEGWTSLVPRVAWPVVLAAMAIYAISAGVGALWPTRHVLAFDVAGALRRESGLQSGVDDRRLRPLVVAQIAVVAALLMLGTLFGAAVDRYATEDRGFDVEGLSFTTARLGGDVQDDEIVTRIRDLLDDPVLRAAGGALGDPPLPGRILPLPSLVRTSVESPPLIGRTWLAAVSAEYPDALGIDLVDGRFFDANEAALGSPVAVIDTATAEALDLRSPLVGATLLVRMGAEWHPVEVVGLVESLRVFDARTSEPIRQVYLPYGLIPARGFQVVTRTTQATFALAAVGRGMPDLVVERPVTLESMYRSSAFVQLLAAWALRVAAGLALALAIAGSFAVLTQATERRRREFGIRMAVGSSAAGVAWLTFRSGLKLAAVGVTTGASAAVAAAYVLRSALFGVPPWDLGAVGATAAIVVGVSSLALVHPAVRSTRSDPADLMRSE